MTSMQHRAWDLGACPMSLDIQSELNSQARAVEIQPETSAAYERMESVLLVLASGLATVVISAAWVALSLG